MFWACPPQILPTTIWQWWPAVNITFLVSKCYSDFFEGCPPQFLPTKMWQWWPAVNIVFLVGKYYSAFLVVAFPICYPQTFDNGGLL